MITMKFKIPENVARTPERMERLRQRLYTKTGPDLQKLFQGTISGWEHKPNMAIERISEANAMGVVVGPMGANADIYKMVSLGTSEHPISPRHSSYMTLQRYHAATQPGSLKSGRGYRYGAVYKAYHTVTHKGFEGRAFPEQIADLYEPTFQRDMQDALDL